MDQEFQIITDKICILVVGMAGTGKTTFVYQLQRQLEKLSRKFFTVNMDPAVYNLPYTVDVDIRNSINYKELMTKNNLGPNGAIMTALNLYCLQINDLMAKVEGLPKETEIVIVDTPGQIEAFTWSASGNIIAQTFSSSMPTIIAYVIDVARCQNPNTLMSNLLFCCSIFYKMKLPLIVVFNKCDVGNAQQSLDWIQDYEKFQDALNIRGNYLSTLNKQMALTLEEFYQNFKISQVSSLQGVGFEKFIGQLQEGMDEITLPDIRKNFKSKQEKEFQEAEKQIQKIYESQNQKKQPY